MKYGSGQHFFPLFRLDSLESLESAESWASSGEACFCAQPRYLRAIGLRWVPADTLFPMRPRIVPRHPQSGPKAYPRHDRSEGFYIKISIFIDFSGFWVDFIENNILIYGN